MGYGEEGQQVVGAEEFDRSKGKSWVHSGEAHCAFELGGGGNKRRKKSDSIKREDEKELFR
jgi:hypothetical protein